MAYADFSEFRVWRGGNQFAESEPLLKRGSEA
jgi:hypothetical protein